MKRFAVLAVCLALVPVEALAQALPPLSSLRVSYNTRKTAAKPEGALKTQIDEIDRQIAEANRMGRIGDVRRLYAKGQALLAGGTWTDELEFASSMTLRSERVLADSSRPYVVRLEQIYTPGIALERALSAHAVLRKRPAAAAPNTTPPPPETVRDFATSDRVSRDLRESPHVFELSVAGVPDGGYQLAVEVSDGARSLGTATLNVHLMKGLDTVVTALEASAAKAPPGAARRHPVPRRTHAERESRAAGAAHLRSRARLRGGAGRRDRSAGWEESVRLQDWRFQAALSARGGGGDHAVSALRPGVVQRLAGVSADHRAARRHQNRRLVLRLERSRAAAAGREDMATSWRRHSAIAPTAATAGALATRPTIRTRDSCRSAARPTSCACWR